MTNERHTSRRHGIVSRAGLRSCLRIEQQIQQIILHIVARLTPTQYLYQFAFIPITSLPASVGHPFVDDEYPSGGIFESKLVLQCSKATGKISARTGKDGFVSRHHVLNASRVAHTGKEV